MTCKSVSLSSAMLLLWFSSMAAAQDAPSATQAAPPQSSPTVQSPAQAAEPPAKLILKEGTDVNLKFAQDLSSKTATDDDPVNLVLDEDLKVGDVTVAKAGAKALGTVTNAKKAGMMGKGGELNLRLEYLIVGDSRMRIRGTRGREGEGKVGTCGCSHSTFRPNWTHQARQERGDQRGHASSCVCRPRLCSTSS